MELRHDLSRGGINKLTSRKLHKPPPIENERVPFPQGNLRLTTSRRCFPGHPGCFPSRPCYCCHRLMTCRPRLCLTCSPVRLRWCRCSADLYPAKRARMLPTRLEPTPVFLEMPLSTDDRLPPKIWLRILPPSVRSAAFRLLMMLPALPAW